MIEKKDIERLVEKATEGTDAFVVSVSVSGSNDIVVELDSMTGVDLDFCAAMSRSIAEELDRQDENYSLEVGSASLTAPFRVLGQYEKNLGNEVEVLTRDGRKLHGTLTDVNEDTFTVAVATKVREEGKKRPVVKDIPEVFAYPDVKEVRYRLEFK